MGRQRTQSYRTLKNRFFSRARKYLFNSLSNFLPKPTAGCRSSLSPPEYRVWPSDQVKGQNPSYDCLLKVNCFRASFHGIISPVWEVVIRSRTIALCSSGISILSATSMPSWLISSMKKSYFLSEIFKVTSFILVEYLVLLLCKFIKIALPDYKSGVKKC